MREMVKMVVTLAVLAAVAGGLLSAVKISTEDRIDMAILEYVQGPAILLIMENVSNNPLEDRFSMEIDEEERNVFVGKINGTPKVIAYETKASGYGGELGVMVGINIDTGRIHGIGVTTHSETPGVGSRAETDVRFKASFVGLPVTDEDQIRIRDDGGEVSAIGGATVTSRAVARAVQRAGSIYRERQSEIKNKVEDFS